MRFLKIDTKNPQKRVNPGLLRVPFALNFYSHHEHGIPKGKDTVFFFHCFLV